MNDEEAVALIVGGHTTGRLGTFDPRVSGDWLKKAESWSKAMGVCSRRLGRRKVAPALRGRRRRTRRDLGAQRVGGTTDV
jgi:catalase (peroxidase I)